MSYIWGKKGEKIGIYASITCICCNVGETQHLVTCGMRNIEQERGNFLADTFDNN